MMIKWIASLKLEVIYFSLFILSSGLLHIKQTLRISYKSNYYFICHLSLTLSLYFTLQTSQVVHVSETVVFFPGTLCLLMVKLRRRQFYELEGEVEKVEQNIEILHGTHTLVVLVFLKN